MAEPDHARARLSVALLWAPGVAVGLGAGVVTAHGLYVVADAAGVPAGIAWLYPLITDGLALVAYGTTHRLRGAASRYAWAIVILAAGLSGLAQATFLAGGSTVDASPALRFGIGAWPSIAAAVVAHLLYLLRASGADRGQTDDSRYPGDRHTRPRPSALRVRDRPRAAERTTQDRPSARHVGAEVRPIPSGHGNSRGGEGAQRSASSAQESRPP